MSTAASVPRPEHDWDAIRHRLDDAARALDSDYAPPADVVDAALLARARVLAQELDTSAAAVADDWIAFRLAQADYAVMATAVREVHALENLTALPCLPEFVLGIVNLRGEILSVLDLNVFFGLPRAGLHDQNSMIVLESDDMCFGVLVDAVLGVRQLAREAIQPPLPVGGGIAERYLAGVTADGTTLLRAEVLLADEAIVIREQG